MTVIIVPTLQRGNAVLGDPAPGMVQNHEFHHSHAPMGTIGAPCQQCVWPLERPGIGRWSVGTIRSENDGNVGCTSGVGSPASGSEGSHR